MSYKIINIVLSGKEREIYSKKLKAFENEFSYPLGDSSFKILHGIKEGKDYFSFFEQMGEVHYFVAEKDNKIVGAGCAILRDSIEGKYWYLCDFKIAKEHRGKGIIEAMFKSNFIKFVAKSRKMIAVNMCDGNVAKNGLLKKVKRIFFMFNIQEKILNFHTWSKDNLPNQELYVGTNKGVKDLIVNGLEVPLFHIMKTKDNNFHNVKIEDLPHNAQIMTCLNEEEDKYNSDSISGKGIMISIGFKNPDISTIEI